MKSAVRWPCGVTHEGKENERKKSQGGFASEIRLHGKEKQ